MTDLERITMARVTWRLLPFLLLLYIISWLDRVNVGFAKLQMNADLGPAFSSWRMRPAKSRAICCWRVSGHACGSRAS
jgi:hypothetical protein